MEEQHLKFRLGSLQLPLSGNLVYTQTPVHLVYFFLSSILPLSHATLSMFHLPIIPVPSDSSYHLPASVPPPVPQPGSIYSTSNHLPASLLLSSLCFIVPMFLVSSQLYCRVLIHNVNLYLLLPRVLLNPLRSSSFHSPSTCILSSGFTIHTSPFLIPHFLPFHH